MDEICARCERVGYYSVATHTGSDGYGNSEALCSLCADAPDEPADDETPVVQYAKGSSFVTVYDTDRAYGGPEEGGWYYDTGSVVLSRQVPSQDAERVRAELREKYPYTGKRYSVIYPGTGDYDVVISDTPGADYPQYTPRYE